MNSKLAIALFTCSIYASSSAFAMSIDDIDEQIPSPSLLPQIINDLEENPDFRESPDFEGVLHEALRRKVLEEMKLELPAKPTE